MSSRLQLGLMLIVLNSAIWLFLFRERTGATVAAPEPAPAETAPAARPKPVPPIVIRTNAFDWVQLESEDYRTYIDRLRSIGCPEETIRDIVIADLEKLMAPEVRQVEGTREPPKYWEPKRIA